MEEEIKTYIAIDMGTSGSGCAYCTNKTESINQVCLWTKWGDEDIQYKNPSCILYENDDPLCWGAKAIREYRRLIRKNKKKKNANSTKEYYLIQSFKLHIHTQEPLIIRGKEFSIEKVVTDFLRLIRVGISEELRKQNKLPPDQHVKWTLTVPAIWTDSDKALMRRCSLQAGIINPKYDDSQHFMLALEPESAALPCLLYENVELEPFTRFLVFDAGGGTVDLSVYETTEGSSNKQFRIRQLKKSSGGTCGGKSINDAFFNDYLREEVLTNEQYEQLCEMASFSELEQNFEKFKISYTFEEIDDDDEFFVPVPLSIAKFFVSSCELDDDVYDDDEGELIITGKSLKSVYSGTTEKAIHFVEEIIEQVKELKYIFMVGGFSNSNILYSCLKKRFENNTLSVIKPNQPGIRVLQGAIWFSKYPRIIVSRVSPLTYGICVTEAYKGKEIHYDDSCVFEMDGKQFSRGVFKVMVSMNDVIEVGTRIKIGVKAMNEDVATFEVYQYAGSSEKTPVYVKEKGCEKLTTLSIPVDEKGQEFEVYMIFGETELRFEVLDKKTKKRKLHQELFELQEEKKNEKMKKREELKNEIRKKREEKAMKKKKERSVGRSFRLNAKGELKQKKEQQPSNHSSSIVEGNDKKVKKEEYSSSSSSSTSLSSFKKTNKKDSTTKTESSSSEKKSSSLPKPTRPPRPRKDYKKKNEQQQENTKSTTSSLSSFKKTSTSTKKTESSSSSSSTQKENKGSEENNFFPSITEMMEKQTNKMNDNTQINNNNNNNNNSKETTTKTKAKSTVKDQTKSKEKEKEGNRKTIQPFHVNRPKPPGNVRNRTRRKMN